MKRREVGLAWLSSAGLALSAPRRFLSTGSARQVPEYQNIRHAAVLLQHFYSHCSRRAYRVRTPLGLGTRQTVAWMMRCCAPCMPSNTAVQYSWAQQDSGRTSPAFSLASIRTCSLKLPPNLWPVALLRAYHRSAIHSSLSPLIPPSHRTANHPTTARALSLPRHPNNTQLATIPFSFVCLDTLSCH